ncbi:hypothetical protein [Streptomyces geranii]|uniref:hypothetical protein n=1 Tax=Streptomyces geranii TaxID=2058923 RepID=UPI0018E51E72|nr:hypothetical protein [Streptomyces geranii]
MSAKELLKRYVAVWNEPDPAARRTEIADLWTPDGLHHTQTRRFQGTDSLVARVTEAHDQFVSGQGLRFREAGDPVGHHDAVAFNWAMSPAADDTVLAVGFDVVLLDTGGRIRTDYQFNEPPTPDPDLDTQAERHLATAGSPPEHLAKRLADLYLPDARLIDENGVHEGPEAIATALTTAPARHRSGNASAQHDAFRYPWRTDTGETGVDFLLRDNQGVVHTHYRFTGAGRFAV